MNINFVPGGQDYTLKVEDAITKSASFAGTAFDLQSHGLQIGTGVASGVGMPLNLVFDISSVNQTSGSKFTLTPIESDDYDGSNATTGTWTTCGPAVDIIANGSPSGFTTTTGVVTVPCIVSKRYLRGSLTLTGAGTTTLSSWLTPKGFAGTH